MRPRPDEMFMLRGPDGLDDVLAKLRHGPLAIDTETTGLDWRTDRVGSINLAAGRTAVFAYRGALAPIARYLSRQIKAGRTFVFHEAKFDMHMLRETFGLHFPYPVHDTKVMSHMLDNRGVGTSFSSNHHLKDLAKQFVDHHATDAEKELLAEIKAAGGKSKGDWLIAPAKVYAKYSALDPWYTLQLFHQFSSRIRGWTQPEGYPSLRSLYQNERWLTLALRDMEERGIMADRRFLEQWKVKLEKGLRQARAELVESASREINWNSVPQLRSLLYDRKRDGGLGLTTERMNKKKTEMSTDKTALVKLNHPIGAQLLNFRKLSKQHGTFATGLLNAMSDDGSIHTYFNQNVDTGRMSSREPNLQQEDKKSGVRGAFIPRKGLVFRMADYSQVEMRFASHFANERGLIKTFNDDPNFDAHTATAMRMFGVKVPTADMRDYAKTMNFAILYGAGEDKTAEGLMNRMTVTQARMACMVLGYRVGRLESPHRVLARLLRERYRKMMPRMVECTKEEEAIAAGRGFVTNGYGRHRYLDANECYKAFNTKIQGTAADRAKFGLVAVYRELMIGTGELAILLQVHDEIIYESEGSPRTDKRVLELLQDLHTFQVPIIADMSGSDISWQDKKKIPLKVAA
jgi:DNA polymerase I